MPAPIVQRFAGHADVTTRMRYCTVAGDVYADSIVSALAESASARIDAVRGQ